jgi:FAD/FMN-containing dehydrogenase
MDVPSENGDDVVAVCGWAASAGYKVRARGIMHIWSPITVVSSTPSDAKIMLIDATQYLTGICPVTRPNGTNPQVTMQTGATMLQLLTYLEQQPGRRGSAPGYSFPQVPAPGNLTVGGVLAIDAHGTAVPSPADSFAASYGFLSNQVLAFTAVVTDLHPSIPAAIS